MKLLILILLMIGFVSFTSASCEDGQIDINSASLVELDELTGIGPVYAGRIVENRRFDSIDDLVKVKGIGEITLRKIKVQGLACVEGEEIVEDTIVEDEVVEEDNIKGTNIEETGVVEENVEEVVLSVSGNVVGTKEKTETILLNNEKVEDEEVIYISKDAKVVDYLVYAFAIFLIVIIGFLISERF